MEGPREVRKEQVRRPDTSHELPPEDELLDHFPSELRARYEQEAAHMEENAAREYLMHKLMQRSNVIGRDDPLLSHLSLEERYADEPALLPTLLRLRDLYQKPELQLGGGEYAKVVADPANPSMCYKIIYNLAGHDLWNSIAIEARFLEELRNFTVAGVRSPDVYGYIDRPRLRVLSIERLDAINTLEVLEGGGVATTQL